MEFISGEDRSQTSLFPESIEDYVGDDNAVRVIDAYIDSLDLAGLGFGKPEPNDTGRPMYDPRDMLKLYVYGYMNRIRSSRRLETESRRNIGLLGRLSPDHKTIARFRSENAAALKNVFRDFVKLCMGQGLYGRELIAIDGSKFKAVNSKDRNFTGKKLLDRIARIDARIEEYLGELEAGDRLEAAAGGGKRTDEIRRVPSELSERRKRYGAYAEELERTGETQKSLTDPDSRLMMANGKTDVCYNVQTAVDAENKLIVEFEVTNNASDDNQITPMAAKAKEILEADALTAVLDAGYDSIQDIVAATNLGVDVHVAGTDFDICVPSDELAEAITAHKDGRPVYFAERNIALCPMGKVLYPGFYKKSRGHGVFHNRKACEGCSCKCTREMRGRRYQVPMAESAFSKECDDKGLHARRVRIRPDAAKVGLRKSVAEHPFGTIKRGMDAGYCLTKGLGNVLGEFSLVFLAYNLKRAVNILGVPRLMRAI